MILIDQLEDLLNQKATANAQRADLVKQLTDSQS